MPNFDLDFDVICERCGSDLSRNAMAENASGVFKVIIEPCEDCLNDAYNEGHEMGYDKGYADGIQKGGQP